MISSSTVVHPDNHKENLPQEEPIPDIFISYSSKDRTWVLKLAQALEDCGFYVWWDHQD